MAGEAANERTRDGLLPSYWKKLIGGLPYREDYAKPCYC
jgi:hypothetical protein